jgi:hypothetical protein
MMAMSFSFDVHRGVIARPCRENGRRQSGFNIATPPPRGCG